jgi:hypothetical protein
MTVDLPYSVWLTTGGATRKGALACVDRATAAQRVTTIPSPPWSRAARAPFARAGLSRRRETECETAVTAGIDRQPSPQHHMGKSLACRLCGRANLTRNEDPRAGSMPFIQQRSDQ